MVMTMNIKIKNKYIKTKFENKKTKKHKSAKQIVLRIQMIINNIIFLNVDKISRISSNSHITDIT